MKNYYNDKEIQEAVNVFWETKLKQSSKCDDTSQRGSVLGGKQMDGFIHLLETIAIRMGVPSKYILTRNTYLPGFFRSSKNWDFMIISPKKELLVVIELKSQIGSYGNNFNNRTEEVLGSSTDFWAAIRNDQIPFSASPWIGYLLMVGKDPRSESPVKNQPSVYPLLPEFDNASYLKRYSILCHKLVSERLYTSVGLLWTNQTKKFGDVSNETSIKAFLNSYIGKLYGHIDEYQY